MLDKMVPNVLLLFTTLAILNSIGIVTCRDDREHGLATNCTGKSMKIYSLSQKFSNFLAKHVSF